MKTFTMVVEQEPKVEKEIRWDADTVPALLFMDGHYYVKVGRYASPGDRYCFHRETPVIIPESF